MTSLTTNLRHAIESGDAIIRIHANLTPAAGAKILPPTYAGGGHNMTPQREDGSSAWCSVDSPASFANRVEAALVAEHPELAPLRVQVGDQTISTLEMPHRAFDATLRESELEGVKWVQTDIAKAVGAATPEQAYPLLQYSGPDPIRRLGLHQAGQAYSGDSIGQVSRRTLLRDHGNRRVTGRPRGQPYRPVGYRGHRGSAGGA